MRTLVLFSAAAAVAMAGGYSIPENSINSVALSAAYVAHANGADAAYYNPAALVYSDDANQLEIDATYIGLNAINYQGTYASTGAAVYNINSEHENFLVPTFHFASKKLGESGARVGLSIVSPAGLSKRWTQAPGIYSAQEFTLKTVEINPSFAMPLNEKLSFGAGFRLIKSSGVVKASGTGFSQDMEGDGVNYGYNLALNYRPSTDLSLAATYRSNVDLNVEGNANLFAVLATSPSLVTFRGNYGASVSVPVPAALNLAASYTFDSGTTLEAVYTRTLWSKYESIDFNFDNSTAEAVFGRIKPKNWRDTNSYRLGVTQKLDRWTAMAGIAYDQTPAPVKTLGYELPDSDALIVSVGGRYQIDPHWNVGLAALADLKKSRTVSGNDGGINGEFSNARAYLVTAGIGYRF